MIRDFADAVAADAKSFVATKPEDVLYDPVRAMLKACGELWSLDADSRQQVKAEGIGWPDLGVTTRSLLCGHIELKEPDVSARPESYAASSQNGQQWKRYKALPNLIYTNGSEWSLYHAGKRTHRVRIADEIRDGSNTVVLDRVPALRRLLYEFLNWEPIAPKNARGLAEFLAPLARFLRDEVSDALEGGNPHLQQIATDWRRNLFPEADDQHFADSFTQTLTYALLLARFEGAVNVRRAFAVETLRDTEHDLLATALDLLETARGELSMPFELLERAIGVVNAPELLRDPQLALLPGAANASTSDDDPWLYFYEDFLAAYDPKLRKNRGVFYTPVPVVKAQVRFASELLRDRFVKRDGFADSSVVVLDPACGTGAYPLAVIEDVEATVRSTYGQGMIPDKLRDLAARLHAFEILVGPYSVAHLRLTQKLHAGGATDRNALIYLADTLESPNTPPTLQHSAFYAPLTKERERARDVKRDTRVLVCLGNPPYDREQHEAEDESGYKGGWVRRGDESDPYPILEDFLRPVREAGGGVHLKNLYNDYVYFWRWALWKVFDSTDDGGIVTFITASSYLRGPAFAGMRRKMREVFDDLWIIDLGGDNHGARKSENVFDIETPVAIAIGVRGKPNPTQPARVHKTRIVGARQAKLDTLDSAVTLKGLSWRECQTAWDAPFFAAEAGAYFDWPTVTDVFPWQHSGSQLKRTWPIGETQGVLQKRWQKLLSLPPRERASAFRETRDRVVTKQYRSLLGEGLEPAIADLGPDAAVPPVRQYAYRSFDREWVIAATTVADFGRPPLWRTHGDQQVYLTSLLTDVLGEGPAATATCGIPDLHHFSGRGAKDVIPLYRDAEARDLNITHDLLDLLSTTHGTSVNAEQLLAYAYGVLAQPAYVKRFWDELELPPPRLPITKDARLFARVADLGEELLHIHTYGERFRSTDRTNVPHGAALYTKPLPPTEFPERFFYDEKAQVLHVGQGEFAPVSPEVWEYSVSGMQVVKSWLDRRKKVRSGRKSSPLDDIRPERWEFSEQLLELLWVLERTIELQPEGEALLEEVCASPLFTADELPTPTDAERQAPKVVPGEQIDLL